LFQVKSNKNPADAGKVLCLPHNCLNLHWREESATGKEVLTEAPFTKGAHLHNRTILFFQTSPFTFLLKSFLPIVSSGPYPFS